MKNIKEALLSTLPLAGLHLESWKSREVRRQGHRSPPGTGARASSSDALPPLKRPDLQISDRGPQMRGLESLRDREVTGPLTQPLLGPSASVTTLNLWAHQELPGLVDGIQQTTVSSL